MKVAIHDFEQLIREHRALLRAHGRVQARCSEALHAQARQIESLVAEQIRLRAALIIRDSKLAWAREDLKLLRQAVADMAGEISAPEAFEVGLGDCDGGQFIDRAEDPEGAADEVQDDALEAGLGAADLVICQTGCVSHGAYWRVQDHCRRTGRSCVLVERPDALRIVRMQRADQDGDDEPVFRPVFTPVLTLEPAESTGACDADGPDRPCPTASA